MNNNKIIEKPWGQEIIWAKTKDYVGKLIFINKGHRLSRQFHKIKEETILVKTGILHIEVGSKEYKNDIYLNPGESFHVKPNVVHRFCAPFGEVLLIEVSTPELDDVVRLEDDYNRKN